MGRPGPRSGSVRGAARKRADKINDRSRQNPAYRPTWHFVDAANPSARQSAFQAFGHDHKVNALGFQGTLLALTGSHLRRRQLADLALIRRSPP